MSELKTTEGTKPYVLREGKHHAGTQPGEVVHLNARQAQAFADKFEPAGTPKTEATLRAENARLKGEVERLTAVRDDLARQVEAAKTAKG